MEDMGLLVFLSEWVRELVLGWEVWEVVVLAFLLPFMGEDMDIREVLMEASLVIIHQMEEHPQEPDWFILKLC